ncbi:unnamed protein product [Candidula unifasciata]|uniref:Uncharacterized protein n=1 Tax=Candidula unifasciata TaxID=100452 RepID=A0A8S3Z0V9_9EUPU|nr:unnamed protein product [Candidula unifasciata]
MIPHLCLVLLTLSLTTAFPLSFMCDHVCSIPQGMVNEATQLLRYGCHCIGGDYTPSENSTTTTAIPPGPQNPLLKRAGGTDPDSPAYPPMLTMCELLCMLQIGGDACQCSAPLVPGR